MKHVMIFEQFVAKSRRLNEASKYTTKTSTGEMLSLDKVSPIRGSKSIQGSATMTFKSGDDAYAFIDGELESLDMEIIEWAEEEGIIPNSDYSVGFENETISGKTIKGNLVFYSA
jgi:hypothetical protein